MHRLKHARERRISEIERERREVEPVTLVGVGGGEVDASVEHLGGSERLDRPSHHRTARVGGREAREHRPRGQLRELRGDAERCEPLACFLRRRSVARLTHRAGLGRPQLDALGIEEGDLRLEGTCIGSYHHAVRNDENTRLGQRLHVTLSLPFLTENSQPYDALCANVWAHEAHTERHHPRGSSGVPRGPRARP